MEILGVPIYFNALTVACLLPFLLCLTGVLYILTLRHKTLNTWIFACMALDGAIFVLGYAIASSIYDPAGAFHRWITVFSVLPAAASLFFYFMTYSEDFGGRIPAYVFVAMHVVALLASWFFARNSLASAKIFRLSGQFWDFEMPRESLIIAALILAYGIITFICSVAKYRSMKNRKNARTFLHLVLVSNLYLFPSAIFNPLARKGIVSFEFFLWVQAIGTASVFLVMYLVFLSHTRERTTVAGNMIGVMLLIVLTCIPVFGYPLIEERKSSFREIWSARLSSGNTSMEDPNLIFFAPVEAPPTAGVLEGGKYFRDSEAFYAKALTNLPSEGLLPRADGMGGVYAFYVTVPYRHQPRKNEKEHRAPNPSVYAVGVDLIALRQYIHPTALKLVLAQIIVIMIVVTLFPIFFRGILLTPMQRLLDGVIAVSRGHYRHRIESSRSDELGVISRHFDQMAVMIEAATVRLEDTVRERTAQLSEEKKKSDTLLLNILPKQIAAELKESGRAKPVRIASATVLFTDFVGFTKISESLTPEEVVDELDKCFSYFDQVTEKYRLEKLKTIGDAFMCAGGVPTPNRTHAIDCCLAALEIQAFMNQMKEIKHQQGFPYWELRLGMNTGPLVAGVVGHKKFAYDVWGDTVNTASRLESSGIAGKINISLSTYEQVKDFFICEHRGQVNAKNKGEIDMYFLTAIKPGLAHDSDGRVPNEQFRQRYKQLMRGRE